MNEEISRIDINNVNYKLKDEDTRVLGEMGKQALIKVGYYVCSTPGSTAEKTISAADYTLSTGGCIKVKMDNANTANNATMNISSTGAKALYYQGERASATNSWEDGETLEVYYDGTSYYANNVAGGGKLISNSELDDVLQDDTTYLLDGLGNVVNDVNDEPIETSRLELTVEELNTLLTGRTGDNKPNTIPDIVEELYDIDRIRSGASKGSTAYQKPSTGIPASDIAPGVVPIDVTRSQNDATFVDKDGTVLFYLRQANHELAGLMTKNDKIKLDSLQDLSPLVPSQASAQNQLADKDFVNSSIATSTANFKGTFKSVDNLPTTDVDDNDYAFVYTIDAAGNTVYKRYKYSSWAWAFEYDLNNSSFTAAQWAAINSGVTAANAVLKVGTTSASPMTGALYFSNNSYIKNAGGDVVAKVGNNNCFGNVNSTSRIRSSVPVDRVGASETVHMVESPSIVTIVTLTQEQYDALATKDANTEYNIIENEDAI